FLSSLSLCPHYPTIRLLLCFLYCSAHHRFLHSFPTRRSSDLSFSRWRHYRRCPSAALPRRRSSTCSSIIGSPSASHHSIESIAIDRKSTRLNSSHQIISYAVFCLKKKKNKNHYSINTSD